MPGALLGLQQRARRRPRLDLVRALAGRPAGAVSQLGQRRAVHALLRAGILVLIISAPRRPRFGAMAFLVVAAFLMTNKVYSPQYVLWLLPPMILARLQVA